MARVTDCIHKDRPHYAKGLCAECYRALTEVVSRRKELNDLRRTRGAYRTEDYKAKSRLRKLTYRQLGNGKKKDKEYKKSGKYKEYLEDPRTKAMKVIRHRLSKCRNKEVMLFDNPHEDYSKMVQFYVDCPGHLVVDHIVPLSNKLVCGLFVSWNLQYITPEENSKKGREFDGTYENESWRYTEIECVETGKRFKTQRQAAKEINTPAGNISNVLNGKYKQIKGFTFRYVNTNTDQG